MLQRLNSNTLQFLIIAVAAIFFIPFLGNVHLFDWDEINFAESAREMIVTGDYSTVQIDYMPFWEKPPLFIWMQVISMKMFGINEFAARFPNALCGIFTLLLLFRIGYKLIDKQFGVLWTLVYFGSLLPHMYFKSGIIDPWFNLFIFLGIYQIIRYFSNTGKPMQHAVLSAFFIGLGILTKGPVALLLFGATAGLYILINKFRVPFKIIHILVFIIVLTITGGFWFILMILKGNFDIIQDFIEYQIRLFNTRDSGHGGFFGYHFVVFLFGIFPASIFAISAFKLKKTDSLQFNNYKSWMIILTVLVLVIFSIVKTKIVHYSSLMYFPVTFLATSTLYNYIKKSEKWPVWQTVFILTIALILVAITAILQYVVANAQSEFIQNAIADKFTLENLQAQVQWSGFEFLASIFYFLALIILITYFKSGKNQIKTILVFFFSGIYFNVLIMLYVGRVEKYSQNAALEFYKQKEHENCYVETIGFKSYADLFYTNKKEPENRNSLDRNWLLTGPIDKPVYFVTKVNKLDGYLQQYPQLKILYKKNGYVFLKREIN